MKLEHPEREEWGDYSVFMKPGPEADKIIKKLEKLEFVESVTRVGCFINVRLKNEYLVTQLDRVLSTQNAVLRGEKDSGGIFQSEYCQIIWDWAFTLHDHWPGAVQYLQIFGVRGGG